jgi:hypothetical protein
MVTHIGPNGPGECGALHGKCPFGEENHFASAEEARTVWENQLASQHPPFKTKLRLPDSYSMVEAKRSDAYKELSDRMAGEFGDHWSARMDEPGTHHAYSAYSQDAELYDRLLKGMKFAAKDENPTPENLAKEKAMIDSWLKREAGQRWDDWEEMVDEPEFDEEFRDLYDRRENISFILKNLKA